jgi:hypothetical protein
MKTENTTMASSVKDLRKEMKIKEDILEALHYKRNDLTYRAQNEGRTELVKQKAEDFRLAIIYVGKEIDRLRLTIYKQQKLNKMRA